MRIPLCKNKNKAPRGAAETLGPVGAVVGRRHAAVDLQDGLVVDVGLPVPLQSFVRRRTSKQRLHVERGQLQRSGRARERFLIKGFKM